MIAPTSPPACPACQTPGSVFRAGLVTRRKAKGTIQNWKCAQCGRRFIDPSAPRLRSGRRPDFELKERALTLRRRGLTFEKIGKALGFTKTRARILCCYAVNPEAPIPQRVGVRFEIFVRPTLLESLRDMYRAAQTGKSDDSLSLGAFIGELVEVAVIDYRSKARNLRGLFPLPKLPERTPTPLRISETHKLSDHDREQI